MMCSTLKFDMYISVLAKCREGYVYVNLTGCSGMQIGPYTHMLHPTCIYGIGKWFGIHKRVKIALCLLRM